MLVNNNIRRIRDEKNITEAELAKRIGRSIKQLRRYENGETALKPPMIAKIAAGLEVPPDAIMAQDGFDPQMEELRVLYQQAKPGARLKALAILRLLLAEED